MTELTQFLDTFYNDVEGWLELADIYTSCNQCVCSFISSYQTTQCGVAFIRYTLALQALSHVLILSPQNPFYVLQAAETAYTLEDIPLAIKWFLLVVDMTTDEDAQKTKPTGIIVRAWYGIALVRLFSIQSSSQLSHRIRLCSVFSKAQESVRSSFTIKYKRT